MNRFSFSMQKVAGFAYLWVLFLIAFMGIGLTVGAEIYTTSAQRNKEQELLAIGRQFRWAIGRYYETQLGGFQAMGKHDYPTSLDDLLQDNRSAGITRHLRKIFVDPMTGKAEWGLVRIGGKIVGIHSLSEIRPIKQGNFEADDMSFNSKEKYSEWVFTYPSDLLLRIDINSPNPSMPNSVLPTPNQTPLKNGTLNDSMNSVREP